MKKGIIALVVSLLFNILGGSMIAAVSAISPGITIPALLGISLIPTKSFGLMVGVYKEVWTGEMVKAFKLEGTFLEMVPDQSRFVENDVIHLVKIGVKPDVLINNSTYPLTPAALGDTDIPISLDKLETVPSAITDDELYAISYPKMQTAIELHKDSLEESALKKAIHAFAPDADAAATPIVRTTGGDNGNSFKRMTIADLITLKRKFDDNNVPLDARVLVLCPQHVEDLLLVSEAFQKQYQNVETGKLMNLYSFKTYEFGTNPLYDNLFAKKAYGSAPAGTDRDASVAFYAKRMFKAKGSTKPFFTKAEADALNKTNYLSYNQRFIALPKTAEAIGAIVNDTHV